MGRRKKSSHLPPRMRLSHGAYYHVCYRSTPEGRRQVWQRLGTEYPTALQRYHRIEADRVRNGRDVAALISAYLDSPDFACKARGTKANYRIFARELSAAFAGVLPADVTPADAQEILDRATKRVKAQNMVWFLRTVLSWGAARRWLAINPLIGFKTGERARRERYITDAEWAKIEEHASPALRAFMRLAYLTALRRDDVVALRWSAVTDEGLTAKVKKTGGVMKFPLSDDLREVLAELKALRGNTPGLFLLPERKPSGSTYLHRWQATCKAAGVTDATIHDIRRKRLTDVQDAEGIEAARRLAGHTTQNMTQRYYAGENVVELPPVKRRQRGGGE